jgi:hypothetical protein
MQLELGDPVVVAGLDRIEESVGRLVVLLFTANPGKFGRFPRPGNMRSRDPFGY